MRCEICGQEGDYEVFGIVIIPVGFIPGAKSGRPTPEEDFFPDGSLKKFVCLACIPTEFAEACGLCEEAPCGNVSTV